MNALRRVARVGSRMFSTAGVALLVLLGGLGGCSAVGMGAVVGAAVLADDPSVDPGFLSALE